MKGFRIICSWLLITFVTPSLAQEIPEPDSIPVKSISGVVVSASRYNTSMLYTPEAIRVTDRKSIRNLQFRTAPEALQGSAGVFIQKTNHGGGSPFLRGLTGNQTLLLIDGIRLSNATARYGPNQYMNTIDVFSLDKIEYLSGSGSVQYGSDAVGGTIHAFSCEPEIKGKPTWGSEILSRFGTHGMEQSLHGSIQYSDRKLALIAGASWRNFGDPVGGDSTGRQTPGSYKEFDFDIKGLALLSSTSRLTVAFQRVYQKDVWVYHKVILENYSIYKMDPQERELAYLRLHQQIGRGILKNAVITASFQQTDEGRILRKNGSDLLRMEEDNVRTFSVSAELIASRERSWKSNTGLEIYRDGVKSIRTDKNLLTEETLRKRGLYPDGSTMASFAAYSLHTLDPGKWVITAGARFNAFIIRVSDESNGTTRLNTSAVVGNLALMRKLGETTGLFISLNTGFRTPNIDDLGTLGIVDFRYETPNYDLQPEHSLQYQAGYKYHSTKVKGEAFLYRIELYDLIVRNRSEGDSIEGYPVYIKQNSERAYIQGIETTWELDLNKSWQVSGNLTYTFGQNISRNEPLRRIPPLFGLLGVEYSCKNLWVNLEWQAAGKQDRLASGDRDDNRIPIGGTPGWKIFNMRMGIAFRYFHADLSLLNLLNLDYRYHGSGVNAYGRSAFLTLTVQL